MRPAQINIDMRALERSEARTESMRRGGVQNAVLTDVENRALTGQAYAYNVAFPYKGGLVQLEKGCMGRIGVVEMQISHEPSTVVATTDDALEIFDDTQGLQFWLDLEKISAGPVVARLCESGSRQGISLGCDILEDRKDNIDGRTVRVITKARLREISLCRNPAAGDDAFAFIVDTTVTPKPVAGRRAKVFAQNYSLNKVGQKIKAMKDDILARLKDAPLSSTRTREWTINDSNRWNSDETERLQRMHA